MRGNVSQLTMTFQEVYAKLERVFCAELVHGGWCIFKTEKHIILEKSLLGDKTPFNEVLEDSQRTVDDAQSVDEEIGDKTDVDHSKSPVGPIDDQLEKANFLGYLQLCTVAEAASKKGKTTDSSTTTATTSSRSSRSQPSCFNPNLVRDSLVASSKFGDNGGAGSGSVKSGGVKCSKCGLRFVGNHQLMRHVHSVHLGVKYTCPHCHGAYSRPDSLKHHIATMHKDVVKSKTTTTTTTASTKKLSTNVNGRQWASLPRSHAGKRNVANGVVVKVEAEENKSGVDVKKSIDVDRKRSYNDGVKRNRNKPTEKDKFTVTTTTGKIRAVSVKKPKVAVRTRKVKNECDPPLQNGVASPPRSEPLRQLNPPSPRRKLDHVAVQQQGSPKIQRSPRLNSQSVSSPNSQRVLSASPKKVSSSSLKHSPVPSNGARKRVELVEVDINDDSLTFMLNNNDDDAINNNDQSSINNNDNGTNNHVGPGIKKKSGKKTNSIHLPDDPSPASSSAQTAEDFKPKDGAVSSSLKVKRTYAPSLRATKEIVDDVPRYICPHCRIPFNTPANLRKHLLISHKEKRRFMCQKCLHVFDSNFKLIRHLPIHDKPPKKQAQVA